MKDENDRIPTIATYRGVGIHDHQPRSRIEGVVKPEIDEVMSLVRIQALVVWAKDVGRSPESRLLAEAKVRAIFELAAIDRTVRPDVDLQLLAAHTAGLNSRRWRSPWAYGSLFDHPQAAGKPVPVPRRRVLDVETPMGKGSRAAVRRPHIEDELRRRH